MAKQKKNAPKAKDVQDEGLMEFYSSQAKLLLYQYENINQLLGRTFDWTHPANHCEILLRDFLRRHLLQWMSVDKGFIYGLVPSMKKSCHCPEIDILIHNVKDYSPVFKLDDFVIVQPEAVLGIIQVKRTFSKAGKENPLKKGLRQAVEAKQHLLDVLISRRPKNAVQVNIGDLLFPVFSGVVAFDNADDVSLEEAITARHRAHQTEGRYRDTEIRHEISMFLLPTFVGSLRGLCTYTVRNYHKQTYYLYDSESSGLNISLQLLLRNMMWELQPHLTPDKKPFAFPPIDNPPRSFLVPADP